MNLFIETPDSTAARRDSVGRTQDAWVKSMQEQYETRGQAPEGASKLFGVPDAVDAGGADAEVSGRGARVDGSAPDCGAQAGAGTLGHGVQTHAGTSGCDASSGAGASSRSARVDAGMVGKNVHPDASYSLAQESYRDELAFHKQRARRRRLAAIVRVLACVVLIPLALVVVFVGSYIMTCVVNGATPHEVFDLLSTMPERITSFVRAVAAGVV